MARPRRGFAKRLQATAIVLRTRIRRVEHLATALKTIDLRVHGTGLDRRDHHVGGQRGIGREHLEAHGLGLRLQRFDRAAIQTEDIGHIGNIQLRCEEAVHEGVVGGHRGERSRLPLATGGEVGTEARIISAALREDIFARFRQRRLCGFEIVIVRERPLDQFIASEQRPLVHTVGQLTSTLPQAPRAARAGGTALARSAGHSIAIWPSMSTTIVPTIR